MYQTTSQFSGGLIGSTEARAKSKSDAKVSDLLSEITTDIRIELASKPDVELTEPEKFDITKLPIEKRTWLKLEDVVAVVVDLKGSTRLSTGKEHAASTASVYQASTNNAVKVFDWFDADFLQIQGDGVFALFWGEKRYERAVCAGITIQTFGFDLSERIKKKWDSIETGYKVGISSESVLVKRVGVPRNPAKQEPVWAGKPVNFAAKAAQHATAGELIVTATVWDKIQNNDYLVISCGHLGDTDSAPVPLWSDVTVDEIAHEVHQMGQLLRSSWCESCGDDFCRKILDGETKRTDVAALAENSRKQKRSFFGQLSIAEQMRQKDVMNRGPR